MSTSTVPTPTMLMNASKVTVAYSTVYWICMLNQVATKQRLIRKYKAQKETFERYNSPEMRDADRLVANFMEWTPVFWGPMWSLTAASRFDDTAVKAAWTYVGLRAVYAALLMKYGVSSAGVNKPLWAATFPAYICLIYIWIQSLKLLLSV